MFNDANVASLIEVQWAAPYFCDAMSDKGIRKTLGYAIIENKESGMSESTKASGS